MSVATMPAKSTADNPIHPWWMVLISGIAAIIVGVFLFTRPITTTLLLVQVLGWFWFFSGIMNIVMIFVDRRGWGWNLALGIIGILAGLFIVRNPIMGAAGMLFWIVILLGVQAIIYGVVELISSFRGGGFGAAVLGILSIVFGVLILGQPLLSMAVLPWVYGSFMIAGGIVAIIAAFRMKSTAPAVG